MCLDSDKNVTPFLSTYNPLTEECEVRCRRRRQNAISKPCPQCASDYNKHMGFCDSCNHLKKNYSTQLIYKYRWYMCIVHYALELSLINSLVIWRKVLQVNSTHLGYPEALIEGLVGRASHATATRNSPKAKRRRLSGDSLPSQRLVNSSHLVHQLEGKSRYCVWCWASAKKQSN